MDYAESHKLPFGKEVPGHAWYADSVLGCSLLGIILWDGQRRWHFIYLTEVNESNALACVAMRDALSRVGLRSARYNSLAFLSDAGPHFACSRFLAEAL